MGETFAGVDLRARPRGRRASSAPLVPDGATLAQLALRWILDFPEVSTVIPGAKTPAQARENALAADLPPLDEHARRTVSELYATRIAPLVGQRW